MLHPSEPSHLHSLLSKFWPSACDKKWQLKSLEGFEFTVFCTVRLTCSCLSKPWPSAAVSLWEEFENPQRYGDPAIVLDPMKCEGNKNLHTFTRWPLAYGQVMFQKLIRKTVNPQPAGDLTVCLASEPAEVHTLAWTLTCGVWSSEVTIFCTDDTEHRGKVFIVQYKFNILKC